MSLLNFFSRHSAPGLTQYAEQYISQIKSGERATPSGRNYAKGTIPSYVSFLASLTKYERECEKKPIRFDLVDLNFYRRYTSFLKGRGFSLNTIGRHIRQLKAIMRSAMEEGLHDNRAFLSTSFHAPTVIPDEVYLTDGELDRIVMLDLSSYGGGIQIARDVFLIGVWTAQRVSDYSRLLPENVVKDANGNAASISLVQRKTGKRVIIPCNARLRDILARYNNVPPQISKVMLNRYIKKIASLAGIDATVSVRSYCGGEPRAVLRRKWELVSSHTARRTGATLMYLSGMDVYDICRITGHSNIRTLETYIRSSVYENVDMLSRKYEFFR